MNLLTSILSKGSDKSAATQWHRSLELRLEGTSQIPVVHCGELVLPEQPRLGTQSSSSYTETPAVNDIDEAVRKIAKEAKRSKKDLLIRGIGFADVPEIVKHGHDIYDEAVAAKRRTAPNYVWAPPLDMLDYIVSRTLFDNIASLNRDIVMMTISSALERGDYHAAEEECGRAERRLPRALQPPAVLVFDKAKLHMSDGKELPPQYERPNVDMRFPVLHRLTGEYPLLGIAYVTVKQQKVTQADLAFARERLSDMRGD